MIHPGLHDVSKGNVPPLVSRCRSSCPSSIMVRSAVKSVSNTRSKPSLLSAATIFPVTTEPAGKSSSSPNEARMAGAVWTTTCLDGSASAAHTRAVSSRSVMAPVGHARVHWPHITHTTSIRPAS
ncbi:MAG: hypothetical protein BWY92_01808 [Firmicutes bacterium ADurb.BinA052]|nr:MAG: hypothetical protein BWY92_01808 [Firmicutes bacterium ADurb.BinA052]